VHDTLLCILTRRFMGRHNQTFSKPQDYCRSRNVRIEKEFSQPIPKLLAFPRHSMMPPSLLVLRNY
jgi:hypothetical protein